MSTRRSRNPAANIKNETIKTQGGLVTPNSSMSNGTITPKDEEIEMKFSNITEANFDSFSHDGLPREIYADEGYATQVNQEQERNIRSSAPSFRASRQPSRRRESIDLTAMATEPGESLQIVGQKVNILVAAIEELRELGLKELDTVLPELVLIGDQSAGKSTLLGAISGINLPRSDGMCTKCPANIKTSPADVWSCTVSLTEYYSYDGKKNATQEFPPWEPKTDGPTKKHFKTISEKSELENVLRLAQAVILNPGQDSDSFLPGSGVNAQLALNANYKHKADFSPNLVTIEISGPLLPALSLYDLPGNFFNPDHTDQTYLVKVFEKLSTSYIRHQNAIIICAMSMHIDPGLSKTRGLIAKLKAENRCVGVLTMPDRMQAGSASLDYHKILRGQAHVLPRGYFVSKQPGPDFQLREQDYHAQARKEETAFFDSDARWTGEWKEFRHRCGTGAIQEYLSQELANLIVKSMPNINAKISAHTEAVDEALRALPALPEHNVQHVVRDRLQRFSNGVQRLLEGGATSNEFLSSWSQLSIEFRDAIQAMRPMFTYHHHSDMELPDVIDIDDDSDAESVTLTPSTPQNRKRPADGFATSNSSQRQKTSHQGRLFSRESSVSGSNPTKQEGSSPGSPTPGHNQRFQMKPPPNPQRMPLLSRHTVFDPYLGLGKSFMTIAAVRNIIAKHKRPGLPDHVDDAAKEDICLMSVQPWNLPLEALANETFKMLRATVLEKLNHCLGDYKQTELFRASERNIVKFLDMHAVEQRKNLQSFYKVETYKLFTINNPAFETYKAEELRVLQNARRKRRVQCYVKTQAQMARKVHTEATRAAAEKAVTDSQLGPDPFENEIQLAAYVRGYYKTAGLRFADNLCQSIQGNLFRKVHAEIMGLLEGCLSLNEGDGEATCRALMVEDENEGRQRTELQKKKEKWTVAAASLTELVRKYTMENPIDEHFSEDHDSGYGHISPMGDSATPPLPEMQGLVTGRPSPAL